MGRELIQNIKKPISGGPARPQYPRINTRDYIVEPLITLLLIA